MTHGGAGDGSWSRAFMASSGMGTARDESKRHGSPEWHEARGSTLARARFLELAQHRETDVREALAARRDCPMGVLASLAHDARSAVRLAAAANPRANRAVLEHLARDRHASVLKAVARNTSTPPDVLTQLAQHRKADVRRVAAQTLAQYEQHAREVAASNTADAPGSLPAELRNGREQLARGENSPVPSRRHAPAMYAPRPVVARRGSLLRLSVPGGGD